MDITHFVRVYNNQKKIYIQINDKKKLTDIENVIKEFVGRRVETTNKWG